MTELDLENLKHQVSVRGDMEPHFAIKIGLLILVELVVALYKIAKEVNNIARRIV